MLSTSPNKLQQYPYLLNAILILVSLLLVAAFRLGVIPTFSAEQDMSVLSASEAAAYRWTEMVRFYSTQRIGIPVTGENLTAQNAADILVYRWQEMAAFYSKQAALKVKYGPPGQ